MDDQTLSLTTHRQAGVWARFGRWLRGRGHPEEGEQLTEPMHVGHRTQSRGAITPAPVSDQRAFTVSTVFSATRLIAEIVGTLPLEAFTVTDGDGVDPRADRRHWLNQLLRSPNQWMTCQEFKEQMTQGLVLWGNAYARIDRNSRGEPISLVPYRPDRMKVTREDLRLRYFYAFDKGEEELNADDVLHLKGFGDGWVGYSVIGYARLAMGLAVAAEDYAAGFFANDGKSPGVLQLDQTLRPEQRELVRKNFGGLVGNDSERLFVLEGKMSFSPLGLPMTDAQFLEQRRFSVAEIARFFRVPLWLLMETEKSTSWGTGLSEQNLAFLQYTLEPYLTRWEQAISKRLIPVAQQSQVYAKHDVDALLRANPKVRAERHRQRHYDRMDDTERSAARGRSAATRGPSRGRITYARGDGSLGSTHRRQKRC